ncbi:MAG: hypothetical protein Q8933_02165 [Bacteroidota bacterium]|nr:hypothetical protein [Bacteroidota bacterium]MDP4191021.1 hypothetical protein [Bacteroidota bacterium]
MKTITSKAENPLSDLIDDKIYELLSSKGLIDEKSARDYQIHRKFKELRNTKLSVTDAIETIREEYPYLQFDTIRKIIYQIQK